MVCSSKIPHFLHDKCCLGAYHCVELRHWRPSCRPSEAPAKCGEASLSQQIRAVYIHRDNVHVQLTAARSFLPLTYCVWCAAMQVGSRRGKASVQHNNVNTGADANSQTHGTFRLSGRKKGVSEGQRAPVQEAKPHLLDVRGLTAVFNSFVAC